MSKSWLTITKLNIKNIKSTYLTIGIICVALLVQDFIKMALTSAGTDIGSQSVISLGHYLWLLIPTGAIVIVRKNFRKIVNLGGKRSDFFMGSLISYLVLSTAVSLANTLIFYSYDKFIMSTGTFEGIFNLMDIWGWAAHGVIIGFIQQVVFLMLLGAFTHTLTLVQGTWFGWTVDILIAGILAVFIPIRALREILVGFLRMILFHPNAMLQIFNCLVLGAILYALSYPALIKKKL